jgi:3-oxoacyl-[acyl-carrier protein] reductase
MDLQLRGKRALVTGSSTGIGEGIARMLASEGVSVVVHGRSTERTSAVAQSIREAGGLAVSITADLGTDEDAHDAASRALSAFGGLDILVNNAGGMSEGATTAWFDVSLKEWAEGYNLNVLSTVRMIQAIAPTMVQQGWGRIINISSQAAHASIGSAPEYSAAKNAVNSLSFGLSKALTRTGVTVNTISPGMTRTETLEKHLVKVAVREGLGPDVAKGRKMDA